MQTWQSLTFSTRDPNKRDKGSESISCIKNRFSTTSIETLTKSRFFRSLLSTISAKVLKQTQIIKIMLMDEENQKKTYTAFCRSDLNLSNFSYDSSSFLRFFRVCILSDRFRKARYGSSELTPSFSTFTRGNNFRPWVSKRRLHVNVIKKKKMRDSPLRWSFSVTSDRRQSTKCPHRYLEDTFGFHPVSIPKFQNFRYRTSEPKNALPDFRTAFPKRP